MQPRLEEIDESMKREVLHAAEFLMRLVTTKQMKNAQRLSLQHKLAMALYRKYKDHWFKHEPIRGQAYRAVEVCRSTSMCDRLLLTVAAEAGLKGSELRLPYDVCIWVDPNEVAVRFGEELGAFLPVWSNTTNEGATSYIDKFDFERLCEKPANYPGSNRCLSYQIYPCTVLNGSFPRADAPRSYSERVSPTQFGGDVSGSPGVDDLEYNKTLTPLLSNGSGARVRTAILTNGNSNGVNGISDSAANKHRNNTSNKIR